MSNTKKPRARSVRPKRVYGHRGTPVALRRPTPVHLFVGAGLLTLAVAMTATHLLEHADMLRLMPQRWEDLLIGFPTAAMLGIAGFVAFIWK